MKQCLILLALLAVKSSAYAQFSSKRIVHSVVPHILMAIGVSQAQMGNDRCVFFSTRFGNDTILIEKDSLPNKMILRQGGRSAKVQIKEKLVFIKSGAGRWNQLNTGGFFFKKLELDSLTHPTLDRFFVQAIATCFLNESGITSIKQETVSTQGKLIGVAYSNIPTNMSLEEIRANGAAMTQFCPEDESYYGVEGEIPPYGSLEICYRRSRR